MHWKWWIGIMLLVSCMYAIHKEYDKESSGISLIIAIVINYWGFVRLSQFFFDDAKKSDEESYTRQERRMQEQYQASVGGTPLLMQLSRQVPTTPQSICRSVLPFLVPELAQIVSSYTAPTYPFLQHRDFCHVRQHLLECCAEYKWDAEKFETVIHAPETGTTVLKRSRQPFVLNLFDMQAVFPPTQTNPSAHLIVFEYLNRLGSICASITHCSEGHCIDGAQKNLSFHYMARRPPRTTRHRQGYHFGIEAGCIISVDGHSYTVKVNDDKGERYLQCFAFRCNLPLGPSPLESMFGPIFLEFSWPGVQTTAF